MEAAIQCRIGENKVIITNNAVKTSNQSLQIELVKRLIDCKSLVKIGECALALFYNKYLKYYAVQELEFISKGTERNAAVLDWNVNQAA